MMKPNADHRKPHPIAPPSAEELAYRRKVADRWARTVREIARRDGLLADPVPRQPAIPTLAELLGDGNA